MNRALIMVFMTVTACHVSVPPDESPYLLAPVVSAVTPHRPQDIAVFAGRPTRAYDVIALIASCRVWTWAGNDLLDQAAKLGADAISEVDVYNGAAQGICAAGIAVRFR